MAERNLVGGEKKEISKHKESRKQDLQRSQNTTEAPVTGKPKGSAVRSHLSLQLVFHVLCSAGKAMGSTIHRAGEAVLHVFTSTSKAENVSQHHVAPNCLPISQLTGHFCYFSDAMS